MIKMQITYPIRESILMRRFTTVLSHMPRNEFPRPIPTHKIHNHLNHGFMRRNRIYLAILSTTSIGLYTLYAIDPQSQKRMVSLVRSTRTAKCAFSVIIDYYINLKFKDQSDDQRLINKSKCHQRSANKLLELFRTNGYLSH